MTTENLVQAPKILMYLHLPKCAGTTVIKSFARLGRNKQLIISRSPESKQQALETLQALMQEREVVPNELAVVTGHDVFVGMHEVSPREPVYATILRDPIARYISHYKFFVDCAQNESHIIHAYAKEMMTDGARIISLEEFTEVKDYRNVMATYLAAANHPDRNTGRLLLRDPEEIMELAVGCLRRMDFIGLMSEFPQDLENICRIAGTFPAPTANKSVHAVQEDEISDTLSQKILDNNRLDIEIFRIAAELRALKLPQLENLFPNTNYVNRVSSNGGIEASDMRRLNALEREVDELKKMCATLGSKVEELGGPSKKQ